MPGRADKKSAPRRPAAAARAKPAAKKPAKATKKTPAKAAKKTPAKAAKKTAAKRTPAKATVKKAAPAVKKAKAAPAKKTPAKATVKKAAPTKTVAKATVKKAAPTKTVAKAAGRKVAPAKTTPSVSKARSSKKTVICPLSGFEVTPGPANLSPKTLQRLRQKLIDEKQRLTLQAADLYAEAEELARDREAGDTQFDEESGEGDTVNVERERDLLLSATARQVIDEIDDALERMKRNKYGVCKPAGRRIALERLEAIPWAQVCVDCKARAERRR